MEGEVTTAGGEVFALTDEQIVGLEPAEGGAETQDPPSQLEGGEAGFVAKNAAQDDRSCRSGGDAAREDGRVAASQEAAPPEWLATRMKDPWHGEEAKELWDGKQRAEKEAAAYREVFATPEDARTLKEIYPGGVAEAKSAAERARALDEMDAAFYRGDAAARMGLAQRMMAEDPAAFRAMVEAGVRLLTRDDGALSGTEQSRSFVAKDIPQDDKPLVGEPNVAVAQGVVRAYGEMERAANAELETSVGAAIGRAMDQALPNLKQVPGTGQVGAQHTATLQDRLAATVRGEVDAALKNDRELGEQVARVLAGRKFNDATRGQVVRLIDARAQQLVPGAVKRVVASWTDATLAARSGGGKQVEARETDRVQVQSRPLAKPVERTTVKSARERIVEQLESTAVRRGRRMDYSRLTDEEILGM